MTYVIKKWKGPDEKVNFGAKAKSSEFFLNTDLRALKKNFKY